MSVPVGSASRSHLIYALFKAFYAGVPPFGVESRFGIFLLTPELLKNARVT